MDQIFFQITDGKHHKTWAQVRLDNIRLYTNLDM